MTIPVDWDVKQQTNQLDRGGGECYKLSDHYYAVYFRVTLFHDSITCYPTHHLITIGTALANSAKFCGIRPRMYIEDVYRGSTLIMRVIT